MKKDGLAPMEIIDSIIYPAISELVSMKDYNGQKEYLFVRK